MDKSKDPQLPIRFAKLIIAELAEIHAITEATAEMAIAEAAFRFKDAGMSSDEALKRAKQTFETKCRPKADKIYALLSSKLNLDA